ncbi:MAG: hypothetical protein ACRCVI_01525, partial [Mycoplasmoidaceae bacterium]
LLFTIGIPNSLDFKSGTSLYIYQGVNVNEVINAIGGNWTIKISTDNFLWIQSSSFYSESEIINALAGFGINSNDLFVAESNVSIMNKIASINTVSLLAASGFVAIYAFIRLGVFAVLPIFLSTILITLFSAALQYIFFIQIESYFIYAMAFIFVLTNILSVALISIIKSRFTSRKVFNAEEIKLFLQRNIMNLSHLWFSLIIIIPLSIGISMIFISTSLVWTFLTILIASLICIPLTLLLNSYLYYQILIFRQKYIKNIIFDNISNTAYKFDAVDEEIIEGINYRS